MAIINTETRLTQILADFVSTRRADLSLPVADLLPFVVGPNDAEIVLPRVFFVAAKFESPHPRRITLTVTVELQTSTQTQALADEHIWAAGLRHALADKVRLQTYLQSLSQANRTGWRLRKYRVIDGAMAVDDKRGIRGRRTDVEMHVRSDEMAPT